jgi:hypothetical protein
MTFRPRRALASALVITATAMPAVAAARPLPADYQMKLHAAATRNLRSAEATQDLRSADAREAARLAAPLAQGHPAARSTRPLPESGDGLPWDTIGAALAGAGLALGGVAAIRRPPRRHAAT